MIGYVNLSPWIQDKDYLEAKRRFKIKTDINIALDDDDKPWEIDKTTRKCDHN